MSLKHGYKFIFITILILAVSSAKATSPEEDTDIFESLVGIVVEATDIEDDEGIEYEEVPENLWNIIDAYYAEAVVDDNITANVLSYLEGVYSEHGYREAGNWAKPSATTGRYIPYESELPDYDYSDFLKPVSGPLTSAYGYRPRFGRMHRGIDLALNIGDNVKCSLPGTVTKCGFDQKGYGNYVMVSHSGGIETLYAHLTKILVTPGQRLKPGDLIGLGGRTGNATGPHLHFETRYKGVPLDPVRWFNLSF